MFLTDLPRVFIFASVRPSDDLGSNSALDAAPTVSHHRGGSGGGLGWGRGRGRGHAAQTQADMGEQQGGDCNILSDMPDLFYVKNLNLEEE